MQHSNKTANGMPLCDGELNSAEMRKRYQQSLTHVVQQHSAAASQIWVQRADQTTTTTYPNIRLIYRLSMEPMFWSRTTTTCSQHCWHVVVAVVVSSQ